MNIIREKLDIARYNVPFVLPCVGEHPRLLFKRGEIEKIKADFDKPQNRCAAHEFKKLCDKTANISLDTNEKLQKNFSPKILGRIEALAFNYALYGDKESARIAIDAVKKYIRDIRYENYFDFSRPIGHAIFTASEVYDWCYDVLTDKDKHDIILICEEYAKRLEIGYPPADDNAVTGHSGEAQLLRDLLSFGVAVYDECDDIYKYCAGKIIDEFVEPRNSFAQAHMHYQGSSYGAYRYYFELWAEFIIYKMSGKHLFCEEYGKMAYEWIYLRRADGQHLRVGDVFAETKLYKNQYWDEEYMPLFIAANLYGDEYVKQTAIRGSEAFSRFVYDNITLTPVQYLVINNPDLWGRPIDELPKTKYFGSPEGLMVARTSWEMDINTDKYGDEDINGDGVIAYMRIGETWTGNHQHLDAGSFQLYYKGILASESGCYDYYYSEHDKLYNKETIAHNTILIYNPNEDFGERINCGGQRRYDESVLYRCGGKVRPGVETGKVTAHGFGPDKINPSYSYIAGDIAKAYSPKATEVLRSMAFIALNGKPHKGVLFVCDKISVSDSSFKKTFLLHTQEEPRIENNVAFVQDTSAEHRGAMQMYMLLPTDKSVKKIGGKDSEYTINGKNYPLYKKYAPELALEAGAWRIEISPEGESETDYMLNVLLAGDLETNDGIAPVTAIETDTHMGAVVYDTVCLFGKEAKRRDCAEFEIEDIGHDKYRVLLTGMESGIYTVKQTGETLTVRADSTDGALWFDVNSGAVQVKKIG